MFTFILQYFASLCSENSGS